MAAVLEGYDRATEITPHDSNDNPCEAFVVGAAGNVEILDRYGNAATIPAIAGEVYRIRCTKILATGTTATGIVGFN